MKLLVVFVVQNVSKWSLTHIFRTPLCEIFSMLDTSIRSIVVHEVLKMLVTSCIICEKLNNSMKQLNALDKAYLCESKTFVLKSPTRMDS